MNASLLLHQLRARHAPADERIARRRALELLGLASAACLAACKTGHLPADAPDLSSHRVAVIGAGLAGLCCAAQLCWAGYDALVFEARPRVGGRVSTLDGFVPGRRVEAGADFIGARHATWLGYAKVHKLELVDAAPADLGARPIVLGGRKLDATESAHLYEELASLLAALNA
ncbi:MAG: FAD-binding protein, partial [Planctomycetota bacterium]